MIFTPLLFVAAVALEPRCATVETVVAELARKSARPLGIRAELKNEVCFVHLQPHDPDTLMRLLARALDAEWTEEAGRTLLDRPASLKRRLAVNERDATAKEIATWVATVLPSDDSQPLEDPVAAAEKVRGKFDPRAYESDDPGYQKATGRLQLLSPIGRLLSRTLRALPSAVLADAPLGNVVRFTNHPRRQQSPLPVTQASLDQYLRERRAWLDKVSTFTDARRNQLGGLTDDKHEPSPGPIWPLVTVQRYLNGTVNIDICVFNARNELVDRTWFAIAARHVPTPTTATWRNQKYTPSAAVRSFFNGVLGRPVDPAQAALVRDPVAHDPLAIHCEDAFTALANARGGETLFPIPDEATNNLTMLFAETVGPVDDALSALVNFEIVDGVRLGHLRHPASSSLSKADRAALRDLLPSMGGFAIPNLDALSAYLVRQNPDALNTQIEFVTLSGSGFWRAKQLISSFLDNSDGTRDLARVYGRMPVPVRTALWAGAKIPFANLPPGSQADLQRMLFHREFYAPFQGRLMDPGVYFDALPMNGELASRPGEVGPSVIRAPMKENSDFLSLGSLALAKVQAERQETPSNTVDLNARFIPMSVNLLQLDCWLDPKFRVRRSLTDTRFDPKSAGVPIDQLPAPHLKEYERVLKVLRSPSQ